MDMEEDAINQEMGLARRRGRPRALHMGFYFPESDNYTSERRSAMEKQHQNMKEGTTGWIVWDSEGKEWASYLIAVGSLEYVDRRIEEHDISMHEDFDRQLPEHGLRVSRRSVHIPRPTPRAALRGQPPVAPVPPAVPVAVPAVIPMPQAAPVPQADPAPVAIAQPVAPEPQAITFSQLDPVFVVAPVQVAQPEAPAPQVLPVPADAPEAQAADALMQLGVPIQPADAPEQPVVPVGTPARVQRAASQARRAQDQPECSRASTLRALPLTSYEEYSEAEYREKRPYKRRGSVGANVARSRSRSRSQAATSRSRSKVARSRSRSKAAQRRMTQDQTDDDQSDEYEDSDDEVDLAKAKARQQRLFDESEQKTKSLQAKIDHETALAELAEERIIRDKEIKRKAEKRIKADTEAKEAAEAERVKLHIELCKVRANLEKARQALDTLQLREFEARGGVTNEAARRPELAVTGVVPQHGPAAVKKDTAKELEAPAVVPQGHAAVKKDTSKELEAVAVVSQGVAVIKKDTAKELEAPAEVPQGPAAVKKGTAKELEVIEVVPQQGHADTKKDTTKELEAIEVVPQQGHVVIKKDTAKELEVIEIVPQQGHAVVKKDPTKELEAAVVVPQAQAVVKKDPTKAREPAPQRFALIKIKDTPKTAQQRAAKKNDDRAKQKQREKEKRERERKKELQRFIENKKNAPRLPEDRKRKAHDDTDDEDKKREKRIAELRVKKIALDKKDQDLNERHESREITDSEYYAERDEVWKEKEPIVVDLDLLEREHLEASEARKALAATKPLSHASPLHNIYTNPLPPHIGRVPFVLNRAAAADTFTQKIHYVTHNALAAVHPLSVKIGEATMAKQRKLDQAGGSNEATGIHGSLAAASSPTDANRIIIRRESGQNGLPAIRRAEESNMNCATSPSTDEDAAEKIRRKEQKKKDKETRKSRSTTSSSSAAARKSDESKHRKTTEARRHPQLIDAKPIKDSRTVAERKSDDNYKANVLGERLHSAQTAAAQGVRQIMAVTPQIPAVTHRGPITPPTPVVNLNQMEMMAEEWAKYTGYAPVSQSAPTVPTFVTNTTPTHPTLSQGYFTPVLAHTSMVPSTGTMNNVYRSQAYTGPVIVHTSPYTGIPMMAENNGQSQATASIPLPPPPPVFSMAETREMMPMQVGLIAGLAVPSHLPSPPMHPAALTINAMFERNQAITGVVPPPPPTDSVQPTAHATAGDEQMKDDKIGGPPSNYVDSVDPFVSYWLENEVEISADDTDPSSESRSASASDASSPMERASRSVPARSPIDERHNPHIPRPSSSND